MTELPQILTTHELFDISFSWYDYTLFGLTLGLSVAIGVYFGIIKKQSTANEYLLGGKQMKPIPVAVSLVASSISGITLLAVPADIYRYGIGYAFVCPVQVWVVIITYFVYLPVFYKLQITSVFEYLEIRFNNKIQVLASILFAISNILFLPIVIYIPALAFSQATGISVHVVTPIICGICIFYTTIGGLKTVVWTDTLQFVIMITAVLAVFSLGVVSTGGFETILQKAKDNERLHISLEMDITKRETIWSAFIGMTIIWFREVSLNQEFVQKCLSLPNYQDVKKSMIIYAIGKILMISLCIFSGLIMFARYSSCDPLSSGQVQRTDQLLAYYVMDVARSIPGLPGLFIAGIFSAALSTLSALMNCLAGTVYKDFLSPFLPGNITQEKVSLILKCLVVIIGIINTALVFVVEKLGGILALSFSLAGVTSGPIVGLFMVGMLVPMVNSTGALCGGIASLLVMAWIVLGRQWYESQGILRYPTLPTDTTGCGNMTLFTSQDIQPEMTINEEDIFLLYRVSFYWYTLIGVVVVVFVSVTVSALIKEENRKLSKRCFSPVIYSLLPKEILRSGEYSAVDKGLTITEEKL